MRSLLGVILVIALPLLAQDPESVKRLDYDHNAPLDVKEVSVEKWGNVVGS